MTQPCSICYNKTEVKNKLVYCPKCKIFLGNPKSKKFSGVFESSSREENREFAEKAKEAPIFNVFKILKLAIFIVVIWAISFGAYKVFSPRKQSAFR